jgi:hypothetical protein
MAARARRWAGGVSRFRFGGAPLLLSVVGCLGRKAKENEQLLGVWATTWRGKAREARACETRTRREPSLSFVLRGVDRSIVGARGRRPMIVSKKGARFVFQSKRTGARSVDFEQHFERETLTAGAVGFG